MNSKTIALAATLVLVGCSSVGTPSADRWRASVDNGDKPGIGIELLQTPNGLSGFMYLLDPNKPNDFGAGVRRPMEIHDSTEREIRFSVQFPPGPREDMLLRFARPLSGAHIRGELQSVDGKDDPRVYEFVRMR